MSEKYLICDIYDVRTDDTDWPLASDGPEPFRLTDDCKTALKDAVLGVLQECNPLSTYDLYRRVHDRVAGDSRCVQFNQACLLDWLYGCVVRAARAADCEQRWHPPKAPVDVSSAVPDLATAKLDLWSIFDLVPHEVPSVREALATGKVDGSTYSGPCCCLIGTVAKARGCSEYDIPGIEPDSSRPAEAFFMSIRPGHVPAVNYHAALAVLWIDEWSAAHPTDALDAEFGKRPAGI